MSEHDNYGKEEIHSKVLRAGRRTYFFDVRATKADDYYLTITESKKHTSDNGSHFYKKHKIYLYKEDFVKFKEILTDVTDYIFDAKGQEVISDIHQPDYHKNTAEESTTEVEAEKPEEKEIQMETTSSGNNFTDINFEDI